MHLKVIPTPQYVKFTGETFKLKPMVKIFITNSGGRESGFCFRELKDFFDGENINSSPDFNKDDSDILLLLDKNFDIEGIEAWQLNEAYRLKIKKDGIVLTAKSFKGLFYAVQTLKQIIDQFGWNLPGVDVEDFPLLKIRGISDDISRGQVSRMENFKKIISFIAKYKMNTYMTYIEDVLKFDAFPSIGKGRGALSKEEVKEIVKFAESKFVEVIPVFETLGHFENILSSPEFIKYAEFPGSASLNISSEETYRFLDVMLKQVSEEFPSEYIHIGADESFDVGKGKSKQLVDSIGIAQAHALHYKRVYDICKKYGKKVMIYGDIILRHPDILKMIPKDFIIVDWHYGANYYYPSVKKFKQEGFRTIVSPAVWNFLTTYPTNIIALPNIKYFAEAGLKNSAIGLISSNWGDYGAETFKELLYYDYAWSAECAWNVNRAKIGDFNDIFNLQFWGGGSDFGTATIHIFSDPLNQFLWNDIWRHPLLKFRTSPRWVPNVSSAAKLTYLDASLPLMKRNVEELEKSAERNKENLKIYRFLINLYSWYSLKIRTSLALQDTNLTIAEKKEIVLPLIKKNIDSLMALNKEFDEIWLKYYKPANLNLIDKKFEYLISYFNEIRSALRKDTLYSPLIQSKWIYSSGDNSWFEKDIEISGEIDSATFQLMGDTFAGLIINDSKVDSVYARRTLSLTVEQQRVKMLDVKRFLKKGKNKIIVHARKFGEDAVAGFNLIGEIWSGGERFEIKSDTTWAASAGEDFNKLQKVQIIEYPYEVIAPNFKTGRKSWIER